MAKIIGKTEDGKDIYGTSFDIEVKECKQQEDGKRIVSMVGSTPSVDRDGDVINQAGWDTKAYRKNPVILWGHDHSIPAIARANKFSKNKDALTFDEIEFPAEGIHKFADMIYSLMEANFIRAGSVGFLPTEMEQRKREDGEAEVGWAPTNFKKQELLEFTICNVGCNRDALRVHLGEKGFKTDGKVKIGDQEYDIKQLIDAIFVEEKEEKEDKTVIPYKKFPLADEDTAWNGPRETREADVPTLRLMSTWFDSENPDVKGSYKLPHHRASDKYTVWNGVRAAMAALFGARGGVDIPDGDRKRTYNHLKKHYVELDKDVPEFRAYEDAELKEIFPELYVEKKEGTGEEKEVEVTSDGPTPDKTPIKIKAMDELFTIVNDLQKAGAVLSRANKNKLKNAAQAINDVLASAESAVEDGEPIANEKQEPPKVELKDVADKLDKLIEIFSDIAKNKTAAAEKVDSDEIELDEIEDEIIVEKQDGEIELDEIELQEKDGDDIVELKDIDQGQIVEAIGNLLKDIVPGAVSAEVKRITGKLS